MCHLEGITCQPPTGYQTQEMTSDHFSLSFICFVSRAMKQNWLTFRKTKRSLSIKNSTFPDLPMHLNDYLTSHTREVFNTLKVREKKLEAVWSNDGIVLAKRSVTGKKLFRIMELRQVWPLAGEESSVME